jgi:hypothetical protein
MSYDPQPGGTPYALPNSTLALVSLITGILGLTFVPLIGSIVAVITGPMAQKEINESHGTLGGEGLAKAGIILGWIGIGLGIIGTCIGGFFFAIPLCMGLFAFSREGMNLILPTLFGLL